MNDPQFFRYPPSDAETIIQATIAQHIQVFQLKFNCQNLLVLSQDQVSSKPEITDRHTRTSKNSARIPKNASRIKRWQLGTTFLLSAFLLDIPARHHYKLLVEVTLPDEITHSKKCLFWTKIEVLDGVLIIPSHGALLNFLTIHFSNRYMKPKCYPKRKNSWSICRTSHLSKI